MTASARHVLAAAVLATAVAFSGSACSASVTFSVPKEQVQQTISDEVAKNGQRPDSVTCPQDLPAEVGKSIRCAVKVGDDGADAVATVTAIEGTTAKFDIKTEPQPVKKESVAKKVAALALQQTGTAPDSVTCASDLQPTVGATADCTLTAGAVVQQLRTTVTQVSGGAVKFDVAAVG